MDPTRTDAPRISAENVRVPHDEFLEVWRAAERAGDAEGYPGAVAQTCRWLAAVPLRTALCGGLPRSPVTQRACVARAALIEAEWEAAREPGPADRPGWADGVRATFAWAWLRQGPPPIDVSSSPASSRTR